MDYAINEDGFSRQKILLQLHTQSIKNSSPKAGSTHVMKETKLWFHISDTAPFQPSHTVSENYFPFLVNYFDYEHHVISMDIWRQGKISQQGYH